MERDSYRKVQKGLLDLRKTHSEERKSTLLISMRDTFQKSSAFFLRSKKNIFSKDAYLQLRIFLFASILLLFLGILLLGSMRIFTLYGDTKRYYSEIQNNIVPHSMTALKKEDFLRLSLNVIRLREIIGEVKTLLPEENEALVPGASPMYAAGQVLEAIDLELDALGAILDVVDNVKIFAEDIKKISMPELKIKYQSVTTFLQYQWKYLEQHAFPQMEKAHKTLMAINVEGLPSVVRKNVQELRTMTEHIISLKKEVQYLYPKILSFLGEDYPRTYVVLLQNSAEVRATGGFIGSLAFIRLNNGWLEDLSFKDVYEFDGQFFEDVPPPPGIEKISQQFRLRDANYWPHFPISAKQVMWFLDKEKGPGVDGVFAITDAVAKELLARVGPVALENPPVTITSKNFSSVMSYLVESKLNKASPKEYLFVFATNLFAKAKPYLLSTEGITFVFNQIEEKKLLAYSNRAEIEDLFAYFSMTGEVYMQEHTDAVDDYLMLVKTAIGANKTDQFIKETVIHATVPKGQGTIENALYITRAHTWNDAIEKELFGFLTAVGGKKITENVAYILGKGNNSCYMRVYVPDGAKLLRTEGLEVSDVEIYKDLGKQVFAFTMNVAPGEEKAVRLVYMLHDPKIQQDAVGAYMPYHFVVEKQPGVEAFSFTKKVLLDDGWVVVANNTTDSTKKLDHELLSPEETVLVKNKEIFSYLFFQPEKN